MGRPIVAGTPVYLQAVDLKFVTFRVTLSLRLSGVETKCRRVPQVFFAR